MVFEAQWVQCRQADLPVRGLPDVWSGTTILHLSDVHAGLFPTNERALRKVVDWAGPLAPDLVFLTGDILGDSRRSLRCLELLAHLRPRSRRVRRHRQPRVRPGQRPSRPCPPHRGPLGEGRHHPPAGSLCVGPSAAHGARTIPLAICGADYLSGGFGLSADYLSGGFGLAHDPRTPSPSSSSMSLLPRRRPSPHASRSPSPATPTVASCAYPAPRRPRTSERGARHPPRRRLRLGTRVARGLARHRYQLRAPAPADQAGSDPLAIGINLDACPPTQTRTRGPRMMQPDDERTSGDLPVTPSSYGDEIRPQLAHEVIATYVADAARSVPGVADLHASAWKGLSSRVREVHSGGVVIRDNERDPVDVEIHARVLWDTVIPELAARGRKGRARAGDGSSQHRTGHGHAVCGRDRRTDGGHRNAGGLRVPEYLPLCSSGQDLLPGPCRSCAWWQTAGIARVSPTTAAAVRHRWTSSLECGWGSPGLIRLPDGRVPASQAKAARAPPTATAAHRSRASTGSSTTPRPPTCPAFATSCSRQLPPEAVVLFCLRTDGPADRRAASRLLHAALKQLKQQRLREVYALACMDGGTPQEEHCEFFSRAFLQSERLRGVAELRGCLSHACRSTGAPVRAGAVRERDQAPAPPGGPDPQSRCLELARTGMRPAPPWSEGRRPALVAAGRLPDAWRSLRSLGRGPALPAGCCSRRIAGRGGSPAGSGRRLGHAGGGHHRPGAGRLPGRHHGGRSGRPGRSPGRRARHARRSRHLHARDHPGPARRAHPHRLLRLPAGGPGRLGRRVHPHGRRRGRHGSADQPGRRHARVPGRRDGRGHAGQGHQRRGRLHPRSGDHTRAQRRLGRAGRARGGVADGAGGSRTGRHRVRGRRRHRPPREDGRLRHRPQGPHPGDGRSPHPRSEHGLDTALSPSPRQPQHRLRPDDAGSARDHPGDQLPGDRRGRDRRRHLPASGLLLLPGAAGELRGDRADRAGRGPLGGRDLRLQPRDPGHRRRHRPRPGRVAALRHLGRVPAGELAGADRRRRHRARLLPHRHPGHHQSQTPTGGHRRREAGR